jgi:hypothetical protein
MFIEVISDNDLLKNEILINLKIAANTLLRLTADGRILLSFKPPGFFSSTKYERLRVIEADLNAQNEDDSEDESQDDYDPGNTYKRENLLISNGGFSALLSDSE